MNVGDRDWGKRLGKGRGPERGAAQSGWVGRWGDGIEAPWGWGGVSGAFVGGSWGRVRWGWLELG